MTPTDYLNGYNDCLMKMQSALYDIQNDMIDLNNRGRVDRVLSDAEESELVCQDVVKVSYTFGSTYYGMVLGVFDEKSFKGPYKSIPVISENGRLATLDSRDGNYEQVGHIYSIKYPATIIDAIKEVKKCYKEATRK